MPSPTPAVSHLLYLHGFRSSPMSTKARMVAARVAQRHPGVDWWCPQLPPSPKAAMEMVMAGIASWPRSRMGVIGSSLGGFYATYVAQACDCRAVLLNPAVDPARDLAKYVGEQAAWHDPNERFFFEPRYVDELRALQAGPLRDPAKLFAVIAKGDEVLDWREMTGRYPGARIKLLEGSDHAITDFDDHIAEVLSFLGLS
ncbi:YqiA/YcfP family alpha/beta fold hydrolase [Ramlibacter sp. PS4R-6]|uniref:YqiA/YcfP family alpha/beta fold hydrolase n=1 Tax=Ramlibacter sp. PS4R-6 TaxID=3133438 RepID=UPI0030AA676F